MHEVGIKALQRYREHPKHAILDKMIEDIKEDALGFDFED